MVDVVKTGFYHFVLTLSESVTKKIIWDRYFGIKAESGRIPAMKKGTAEFAAICLLREYAGIIPDEKLAGHCDYIFYQIFQYTPLEEIRTTMKQVLEKLECDVSFGEYIRVTDYLKKAYGKWLSNMEFCRGREGFSYEEAYDKYKNVTVPMLDGWEDVQKNATAAGLCLFVVQPQTSLNPETERFFEHQQLEAQKNFENFDEFDEDRLYHAYRELEVIPFKTVYVQTLSSAMEKKLDRIRRQEWKQLLERFKESVSDKPLDGRIAFGDDEFKVKQVTDSFVNSGKFEYVMLINDTSRRLNGKKGVAVTTKNLYYKGMFESGEIPVEDISHFEISGGLFSQGLTVHTNSKKKYSMPCNVGEKDYYKYLKVLEQLMRVLKGENNL